MAHATEAPEGLPARRRVRATRDFARIERRGKRSFGKFVVVVAAPAVGVGRVGFTVSKKVGDAHVRNLVKRRLRAIARKNKALWNERDIILIAKPEAAGADYDGLAVDVLAALSGKNNGAPRG